MTWVLWFLSTKWGRAIALVTLGLLGYVTFSQYYQYEGRKQVYEKIEKDTRKAKENRNEIETRTNSTGDSDIDKWLRERAISSE